jgi:hypothetical protein
MKQLLLTAAAMLGLTAVTLAQVPNWQQIGTLDNYGNIIKRSNGNFLASSIEDVYEFSDLSSPFQGLNFNTQIGEDCISQLLGENSAGAIFRATCHDGIFTYNNSSWSLNGLVGYGTGGQYWNKLTTGRLVISKGGFLRNIYYSDNDGLNWSSAGLGDVDWNFIIVSQSQSLFAVSCCGGFGQQGLIKSTDNGITWTYLNSSAQLSTARCIANDLNGALYVIADDVNIKTSTDDGNSWSQFSTTPNNEIGYNLLFSENEMFLLTTNSNYSISKIYYSQTNSINWQDISSSFPSNTFFNEIKYIDGKVFACTSTGLFYANTSAGCSNNLVLSPLSSINSTGSTATFTATTSDSNPSYIWQSDFGQGFQTLSNYGNYSGVETNTLSISNVQLSEHNQPIRVITTAGACIDTSDVAIVAIADTCINTVNDTTYISVTDTLLINTIITSTNPPYSANTIKVFPNPASDHITIDYGNFALMNGYQLRIENSLGQQVFQTNISQQSDYLSLTSWGGNGLYFVRIIDSQGNTIDIRKIVLQ